MSTIEGRGARPASLLSILVAVMGWIVAILAVVFDDAIRGSTLSTILTGFVIAAVLVGFTASIVVFVKLPRDGRARVLVPACAGLGLCLALVLFSVGVRVVDATRKRDYDASQPGGAPARLVPSDADAFVARGDRYKRERDYDRAIQNYDQAIKLQPRHQRAYVSRGQAFQNKRDYDRALRDFDQAIELDPRDAFLLCTRGNLFVGKRQYDRAFADYDRALGVKPGYGYAYASRGHAHVCRSEYERAIPELDRAVSLDPEDEGALVDRAFAYVRLKQYDRALEDYDRAAQIKPDDARTFFGRAHVYELTGDRDRATRTFERGVALSPNRVDGVRDLGLMHEYWGEHAEAEKDMEEALRLKPRDPYFVLWLWIAQARQGKAAMARDALARHAAEIDPKWPAPVAQFYLGALSGDELLVAARDPDKTKEQGQLCEAYFYMAEAALAQGDEAEARRLFQETIGTGVTHFFEYVVAEEELAVR